MSVKFNIVFGYLPSEKNLFGPAAHLNLYHAIRKDLSSPCLASCPLWQLHRRVDVFPNDSCILYVLLSIFMETLKQKL